MSLQIRRGTEAQRSSITPLTAELIYTTDTKLVYVGDGITAGGTLVGIGGGNGNYGNANVVMLLNSGLSGNIIPTVDSTYSLGSVTNQWKDLYVSNNTIFIDNVPLSANGGVLSFDGVPLVAESGTSNISTSGDITGGNVILEAGGGITFSDGTVQTTATQPYLDSDVANFLASGTDTQNIITTANVSAAFFIGDGGFLSNIVSSYGNVDVEEFLPTYTGNLDNVNTITANVISSNATIIANSVTLGSVLTPVSESQWTKLTVASTTPITLMTIPAASVTHVDFNVVATDTTSSSRQVSKLMAINYNGDVDYNEYGSLTVGSIVGDFTVSTDGTDIFLNVIPVDSNSVDYNVVAMIYY
jgi:hypothetical protein